MRITNYFLGTLEERLEWLKQTTVKVLNNGNTNEGGSLTSNGINPPPDPPDDLD